MALIRLNLYKLKFILDTKIALVLLGFVNSKSLSTKSVYLNKNDLMTKVVFFTKNILKYFFKKIFKKKKFVFFFLAHFFDMCKSFKITPQEKVLKTFNKLFKKIKKTCVFFNSINKKFDLIFFKKNGWFTFNACLYL